MVPWPLRASVLAAVGCPLIVTPRSCFSEPLAHHHYRTSSPWFWVWASFGRFGNWNELPPTNTHTRHALLSIRDSLFLHDKLLYRDARVPCRGLEQHIHAVAWLQRRHADCPPRPATATATPITATASTAAAARRARPHQLDGLCVLQHQTVPPAVSRLHLHPHLEVKDMCVCMMCVCVCVCVRERERERERERRQEFSFQSHGNCTKPSAWSILPMRHAAPPNHHGAPVHTHQRPPLYLDSPHQRHADAALGVRHRHLHTRRKHPYVKTRAFSESL